MIILALRYIDDINWSLIDDGFSFCTAMIYMEDGLIIKTDIVITENSFNVSQDYWCTNSQESFFAI